MSSLPMLCLDLKVLQLGMDVGPSTQEKKRDGKKKQKVEAPEQKIFDILTDVKSWMLMPQEMLEIEFQKIGLAGTPLSMAKFLETFPVRSGKKGKPPSRGGAEYYNQIMSTKHPLAIFEYERFDVFYSFVKWLKNSLEKTFTKEGNIATRAAESLFVVVNKPEADNLSILRERLPDVASTSIPISEFWGRPQYVDYEADFREGAEKEARDLVTTAQQLQMTLLQIIEHLTSFYQQSSGKAPETTNEYTKLLRFFLVDLKAVLPKWDFEPPRYITGVIPPQISETPPKLREAIQRYERGEATPPLTEGGEGSGEEGGEEGGEESAEEGEKKSGEEDGGKK